MKSPFDPAWWSFDLGKYRPCEGTYERYPFDSLPPLDEGLFQGTFQYLRPGRSRRAPKAPAVVAAAAKQGVPLPAAFVRFISDPALQAAVPSCTACEWDPSPAPVACRVVPGAWTVRFLRDQQDCLFWYLHLLPDGDAHVLCSPIPFDDPKLQVSQEVVLANTWYCAPHFEHFVYRFWIENEIWDIASSASDEWTPEQRAYVAHYKKPAAKKTAKKTAAKKA